MTLATASPPRTTIAIASPTVAIGITGSQTGTWGGVVVDTGAILVKYTYAGDLDLDGQVTGNDYYIINNNYGNPPTYSSDGDLNYNGTIDADDYNRLDSDYYYASSHGTL